MKVINLVDLNKSDIKYKISKFPDGQQQVSINPYDNIDYINNIHPIYIKSESKSLKSKIKFCEDNSLEEYDENTYKVYSTLAVLKGKKSDIEKAKVIASLINN